MLPEFHTTLATAVLAVSESHPKNNSNRPIPDRRRMKGIALRLKFVPSGQLAYPYLERLVMPQEASNQALVFGVVPDWLASMQHCTSKLGLVCSRSLAQRVLASSLAEQELLRRRLAAGTTCREHPDFAHIVLSADKSPS